MNARRLPLFCGTATAWRIEQAEVQLIAKVSEAARRRRADEASFVISVAGGVAAFAEAGSPFNKVAGLGLGGVPGPAVLAEVERAYAAAGAPVQVELAHLADPAIGAMLTGRGYRLTGFDNVLGLVLEGEPERVTPPGSRSGQVARRSSSRGWTPSCMASPTPTLQACRGTARSRGR